MKFDLAYCLGLEEKLSIYDVRDLNFDESIAFAAEHHLKLAIGFSPVPVVAEQVALYKKLAAKAGWAPTHDQSRTSGRSSPWSRVQARARARRSPIS